MRNLRNIRRSLHKAYIARRNLINQINKPMRGVDPFVMKNFIKEELNVVNEDIINLERSEIAHRDYVIAAYPHKMPRKTMKNNA